MAFKKTRKLRKRANKRVTNRRKRVRGGGWFNTKRKVLRYDTESKKFIVVTDGHELDNEDMVFITPAIDAYAKLDKYDITLVALTTEYNQIIQDSINTKNYMIPNNIIFMKHLTKPIIEGRRVNISITNPADLVPISPYMNLENRDQIPEILKNYKREFDPIYYHFKMNQITFDRIKSL